MALQENFSMDKNSKDTKPGIEETLAELEEDWMQYKESLEQRSKMRSPNVSRVLLTQKMEAWMSPGGGGAEEVHGKVCVLSIDGGGMMGIIPARVLAYLEEVLQKKSGDSEARIADYFDIVAGTSVGGLIATMLLASNERRRPIFSGAETWKLVAEKGKSVFKIPSLLRPLAKLRGILTPRFSTKPLESVLKDYLLRDDGRALTLKDTLKPLLVPCYDLSTAGPFLFSRADALETDDFDFRLWEICRATAAVPGFFKPAKVSSVNGKTSCTAIDGGLVMNNPTAAAVTHVFHNKLEFPHVRCVDDLLVLSLGTGLFEQTFKYEKVRFWGAFQWAKPVVKIVLDGISEMVDHTMSMAFSEHRENYLRIQVSGTMVWPTDINPNSASVKRLTEMADQVLDQPCIENVPFGREKLLPATNRQRLDLFADYLVAEHRARAARVVPTVLLKSASSSGSASGSGSGSGSNSSSGN